jgi:hypothetical protein
MDSFYDTGGDGATSDGSVAGGARGDAPAAGGAGGDVSAAGGAGGDGLAAGGAGGDGLAAGGAGGDALAAGGAEGGEGEGTCLTEDEVAAYVEGEAAPGERARAEAHVAWCAACRRLVSELVRAAGADAGPAAEPVAGARGEPARGDRVGRYVVLSRLGAGAMGVVYAAFDPELERRVALKLLAPAPPAERRAREWRLRREAQAMARVSHPNVVPVFDVGAWAGRVFLAMELCDGAPLSRWCAAARPAGQVLARLVEAGRGLEAAHRAKLVHRDFKPDNVLVGEGGARVTDFGLASFAGAPAPGPVALGEPTGALTATGALVGTPAYMAPEQLRGGAATALSDQFAFCVTAYEALCGVRPFAGASVGELLAAIEAGEPAAPAPGRRPSAGVLRALRRGLAAAPERRFGSMGELLDALAPRRPRRRRALAALAALAATVAAGAGPLWRRARPPEAAPCVGAGEALGGAWDGARRERVARALGAGPPETAPRVEAALDRYARAWGEARTAACAATYVRREQSEEVLALRYACLDRRRDELDALTAAFGRADAAAARKAIPAAEGLADPAACGNVASLLAPEPLPADPARRAEALAVRRDLGPVKAASALGQYREGAAAAAALVPRARAAGHRPLEGEALYWHGFFVDHLGDAAAAERSLVEAYLAAEAGRDDATKAKAASVLAWVLADSPPRRPEAQRWSDVAFAALARLGPDERLEAKLLHNHAAMLILAGRPDEAGDALARSEALETRLGVPAWSRGLGLSTLGTLRAGQGRYAEAAAVTARARDLLAASLGDAHPLVAGCDFSLGTFATHLGDLERARRHLTGARHLFAAEFGPASVMALQAHSNLCHVAWRADDVGEAVACWREVRAAALAAFGPEHDVTANASLRLANAVAEAHPREALALLEGHAVPPVTEYKGGDPDPGIAWLARGRAALAARDRAAGARALRQAVATLASPFSDPYDLAEAEFALARALPAGAEARAVAERARERLLALETEAPAPTPLALALDRWLGRTPAGAPSR